MGLLLKLILALGSIQCAYFSYNKCLIYTHDGTNDKCTTNWDETDYIAWSKLRPGRLNWAGHMTYMESNQPRLMEDSKQGGLDTGQGLLAVYVLYMLGLGQ